MPGRQKHLSRCAVPRRAASLAIFRALHPLEDTPPVPASDTPPFPITTAILAKVLLALPQGAAGGPSRWTFEHIKAAHQHQRRGPLFCPPSHGHDCSRPSPRPSLHCRGTPPPVCQTLRRHPPDRYRRALVPPRLPLCPSDLPAGRQLQVPLQLGVGISGGSQLVGHALYAGMSVDPGSVTVQIDWRTPSTPSATTRCSPLSPNSVPPCCPSCRGHTNSTATCISVDQAGQLPCRRQGLAKETRHCPSSLHSPCSTPWSSWPSPSSCAPPLMLKIISSRAPPPRQPTPSLPSSHSYPRLASKFASTNAQSTPRPTQQRWQ
jgi:hypothetical protein